MVIYGPTVFAIKAAILLFITRIFSPYKTYIKWIYVFLAVMGVYYIVMLFLKIFICRPISIFWDAASNGECFNQRVLIIIDNVISLISDLVVLLLPYPLTKDLHVGLKSRLKVMAVFGMGGIACAFTLVRLVIIVHRGKSPDQTYTFVQISLFGTAKGGIGLICACLPFMPMLWKSIFSKAKPGHSCNHSKSHFEMTNLSRKRSRNMDQTPVAIHLENGLGSDENVFISNGTSYVTTHVCAGDNATIGSSVSAENRGMGAILDDSYILRTVEVHQYNGH
ncbi:hypothetical protein QSH57_008669 [Fusarium oxysporum f. sp. vasinfectum]|nr:hypothetical protein QSH57_008669 [Fusarium oxysporum f. sp. vasinfectum]